MIDVKQIQNLAGRAEGKNREPRRPAPRATQAFSLVEVLFAMAVTGIMVTALYAGLTWCLTSVRTARENLRASEVMVEKMEVIRLLTWDQIDSGSVLFTTFTAGYSTGSATSKKDTTNYNGGFNYYGTITVVPPLDTQLLGNYTNDMRVVQVQVYWTNQRFPHTRKISSYVSRYGIQNYAIN